MESNYETPKRISGVFLVEVSKIKPNTMQPRRVFDDVKLKELSESIRQYGVLQPLVVVRQEREVPNGTFVEYELIAGERRWRASKLAGVNQVPVVIREEPSEKVKLEIALIENLQREDLDPLERAEAFHQLIKEFDMRHHEVGLKVGKSREFVSNTVRLLTLPDEIKEGLRHGLIAEGHTRPLLSLNKNKDEQASLYKEIIYRKMTVREAELLSRRIVKERTLRKIRGEREDPDSQVLEKQLSDVLGTKVSIERKEGSKKVSIEFYTEDELEGFLYRMGVSRKMTFDNGTSESSDSNFSSDGNAEQSDIQQQEVVTEENVQPVETEEHTGISIREIRPLNWENTSRGSESESVETLQVKDENNTDTSKRIWLDNFSI
ncbi:ParB/RepB/Spo0J family partition protein [Patescibacteria group bacterium]